MRPTVLSWDELLVFKTFYCNEEDCEAFCLGEHNRQYPLRRRPILTINQHSSILYSPLYCKNKFNQKGSCEKGEKCTFSHTTEESTYHPNTYLQLQCPNEHPSTDRCPYFHDEPEAQYGQEIKDILEAQLVQAPPASPTTVENTTSTKIENFKRPDHGVGKATEAANFSPKDMINDVEFVDSEEESVNVEMEENTNNGESDNMELDTEDKLPENVPSPSTATSNILPSNVTIGNESEQASEDTIATSNEILEPIKATEDLNTEATYLNSEVRTTNIEDTANESNGEVPVTIEPNVKISSTNTDETNTITNETPIRSGTDVDDSSKGHNIQDTPNESDSSQMSDTTNTRASENDAERTSELREENETKENETQEEETQEVHFPIEKKPDTRFNEIKVLTSSLLDEFLEETQTDLRGKSVRVITAADEMGHFFHRKIERIERSLTSDDMDTLFDNLLMIYNHTKTTGLSTSKALRIFRGAVKYPLFSKWSETQQSLLECAYLLFVRTAEPDFELPKGEGIKELEEMVDKKLHISEKQTFEDLRASSKPIASIPTSHKNTTNKTTQRDKPSNRRNGPPSKSYDYSAGIEVFVPVIKPTSGTSNSEWSTNTTTTPSGWTSEAPSENTSDASGWNAATSPQSSGWETNDAPSDSGSSAWATVSEEPASSGSSAWSTEPSSPKRASSTNSQHKSETKIESVGGWSVEPEEASEKRPHEKYYESQSNDNSGWSTGNNDSDSGWATEKAKERNSSPRVVDSVSINWTPVISAKPPAPESNSWSADSSEPARDTTDSSWNRSNDTSKRDSYGDSWNNRGSSQQTRSGDWNCPECNDLNFAYRKECRKCGAYNTGGRERNSTERDWSRDRDRRESSYDDRRYNSPSHKRTRSPSLDRGHSPKRQRTEAPIQALQKELQDLVSELRSIKEKGNTSGSFDYTSDDPNNVDKLLYTEVVGLIRTNIHMANQLGVLTQQYRAQVQKQTNSIQGLLKIIERRLEPQEVRNDPTSLMERAKATFESIRSFSTQ